MENNLTPQETDKTPMEQLISYIDPIHEGILHKAKQLLEEERKHFLSFGQTMYRRGMLDSHLGELKNKASEIQFEKQYKNKTK
jgi:hypothetical protein